MSLNHIKTDWTSLSFPLLWPLFPLVVCWYFDFTSLLLFLFSSLWESFLCWLSESVRCRAAELWWCSSLPICCAICFETHPPLCTPAVELRDTGKHPTTGSKHFYLSFSYGFGNSFRIKRALRSWPVLRTCRIVLFCFIWGFFCSLWVGLARHLVQISLSS